MIQDNNKSLTDAFGLFVSDPAFPCVGAKSASARGQIDYYLADDMRTNSSDADITAHLQAFAQRCSPSSLFVSFAVIFQNTPPLSEPEFEDCLWQRLQSLHDRDATDYAWDERVSSDPESPHFSMSIGGSGFYVVGLHPQSSRLARQFSKPALIFNLHSQFELLRANGSYERIRNTILERDKKLSGDLNPMLARHGQSSEVLQYSGQVKDNTWKCPFHAQRNAQG